MNGVKILSTTTEEAVVGHYWAFEPSFWSWFGLGCLVIFVILACWSIWKAIDDCDGTWLGLTLLILVVTLVPVFCVFRHDTVERYNQYKVIVDDSMRLNEFFEKYDLIDVDGSIYVVKDKTE